MIEEKALRGRPKGAGSLAEQEMDKIQAQSDAFTANVEEMTLDRMNTAPKLETEPQTKLSTREMQKSNETYLKPAITLTGSGKFNEEFRKEYEFAKEYVPFIAEHNELIGENIEIWTRPYPGMPCEWWKVPSNKPVWGPRYLAEQIKRKCYHRLVMQENNTSGIGAEGRYFGTMAADTTIQRLDARPVSQRKSLFMGSNTF